MIAKDGPINIDRFLGFFYFFVDANNYQTLSRFLNNYLSLKTIILTLMSMAGLFLVYKKEKLKGSFFITSVLATFLVLFVLAFYTGVNISKGRTLYILNLLFLIGLAYFFCFFLGRNKNLIHKILVFFYL